MRFDIITLFPEMVKGMLGDSILARAQEAGIIEVQVHDLRAWTDDKRKTVDDRPFAGNPGMLLMVDPIYRALKELGVYPTREAGAEVWLTSAKGEIWKQSHAAAASKDLKRIVLICGRYEGVDHRVVENLIDKEVSIGNFVLSGGELAAGVIVDSITRLLPGALGNEASLSEESHNDNDTGGEYPQYTRPAIYETSEGEKWEVPEVLLSGNHAEIKRWQEQHKA